MKKNALVGRNVYSNDFELPLGRIFDVLINGETCEIEAVKIHTNSLISFKKMIKFDDITEIRGRKVHIKSKDNIY